MTKNKTKLSKEDFEQLDLFKETNDLITEHEEIMGSKLVHQHISWTEEGNALSPEEKLLEVNKIYKEINMFLGKSDEDKAKNTIPFTNPVSDGRLTEEDKEDLKNKGYLLAKDIVGKSLYDLDIKSGSTVSLVCKKINLATMETSLDITTRTLGGDRWWGLFWNDYSAIKVQNV